MPRRGGTTALPSPFLRNLVVRDGALDDRRGYPFALPWLDPDLFRLDFDQPVTILVGENGTGKSTLIEAIAALAGYDEAGGGKGYRPVDHSRARDRSGADLAEVLRAGWLPKVTTGWFFRAETFFSVARYLDDPEIRSPSADFLSHSHGEGFLRLFNERMRRPGLYLMDEPESALSPMRQIDLLRLLCRIQARAESQVILATHSPLLMAVPGARLLEITGDGFSEISVRDTPHFRLLRAFTQDPEAFAAETLEAEEETDDA